MPSQPCVQSMCAPALASHHTPGWQPAIGQYLTYSPARGLAGMRLLLRHPSPILNLKPPNFHTSSFLGHRTLSTRTPSTAGKKGAPV